MKGAKPETWLVQAVSCVTRRIPGISWEVLHSVSAVALKGRGTSDWNPDFREKETKTQRWSFVAPRISLVSSDWSSSFIVTTTGFSYGLSTTPAHTVKVASRAKDVRATFYFVVRMAGSTVCVLQVINVVALLVPWIERSKHSFQLMLFLEIALWKLFSHVLVDVFVNMNIMYRGTPCYVGQSYMRTYICTQRFAHDMWVACGSYSPVIVTFTFEPCEGSCEAASWRSVCLFGFFFSISTQRLNPFTPKSYQYQISPAASPEM